MWHSQRQGSVNIFTEFKNMFIMTMKDITWNWFEPIMNGIQDMARLKKSLRDQTLWDKLQGEQCT